MCSALAAPNDAIMRIEKQMMTGRARWIADFNESFLNHRVDDVTFDLFIAGNTRSKGFILSRLFSFLLNPNYEVGFFAISLSQESEPNDRRLRKWILAVKSCMQKYEMKWAWLMLLGESPSDSVKKCIKEAQDRVVGVAYADMSSGQMTCAETFLGRQLKKYVKVK